VFLAGVRRHLTRHAYGNATLQDLLESWSACGATDLEGWAEGWLRSAGPDVVHWEDGALVRTPPPGSAARRPHRLELLTVDAADGSVVAREDVRVHAERTPVTSAPRPGAALLLDATGQTWCKARLDADTVAALPVVLPRLGDPVTRASVWLSVRDGVEDGHVAPALAVDLLLSALPSEDQDVTVLRLAAWAEAELLGRLLPESSGARGRITDALLDRLASAPGRSGLQLAAAAGLAGLTADGVLLARWLDGGTPPGLTLDEELRWKLVRQLARLGLIGPDDVAEHAARDRSAQGAVHAATSLASLPLAETKAAVWDRLAHDPDASNYDVYAWCEGFWYAEQTELTRTYAERFFTDIPATASFRTGQVAGFSALTGFPRYHVEADTLALADRALARPDLVPGIRRSLQDCRDDLRRALAVRQA
jgi:aminopeptidase N